MIWCASHANISLMWQTQLLGCSQKSEKCLRPRLQSGSVSLFSCLSLTCLTVATEIMLWCYLHLSACCCASLPYFKYPKYLHTPKFLKSFFSTLSLLLSLEAVSVGVSCSVTLSLKFLLIFSDVILSFISSAFLIYWCVSAQTLAPVMLLAPPPTFCVVCANLS